MSAGIALKKFGHQVTAYEKVKDIRPVGAAISLWSNGVKCLNYLGLTQQIKKLGGDMAYMAYVDGLNDEIMTQFSLQPLVDDVGQKPYPVSRAKLKEMLIEEFGQQDIEFGVAVTHIQEKK